jgi:hypothetical protein
MVSSQVRQMRPFLVVRQVCADAVDHHHHESAVVRVEPVRSAQKSISASRMNGLFNMLGHVGLVESGHIVSPDIRCCIQRLPFKAISFPYLC